MCKNKACLGNDQIITSFLFSAGAGPPTVSNDVYAVMVTVTVTVTNLTVTVAAYFTHKVRMYLAVICVSTFIAFSTK